MLCWAPQEWKAPNYLRRVLLPRCVLAGNWIESRRAGTQTRRCDPGCGHLRIFSSLWQDIQQLAVPTPAWPSPQAGGHRCCGGRLWACTGYVSLSLMFPVCWDGWERRLKDVRLNLNFDTVRCW